MPTLSARVDQWLSAARLFKSRTSAQEACTAGHVQINDVTVKPSDVENKALAKKLNIGDPQALNGSGVNIQSWMPNEDEVALAWEEVSAA